MVTAALRPGLSAWKILLGTAVVGAVSGVVLGFRQAKINDELDAQGAALAAKAIPTGAPAVIRPVEETPQNNMMAPDPRSLSGLPAYPGASPRRMVSTAPGAPSAMAISWFETKDSLEDVLTFYENAFGEANVLFTSHRYNERRGYVSWFERRSDEALEFGKGYLHMVTATREGDHTTVLLSVSEPQKLLENLTPLPAGLRIPLGATPQVLNSSELGQQRATILAHYNLSPDAVREQVLDIAKADGWKVETRTDEMLVLQLNNRQQTVVIGKSGEQAELFITLEER